MTDPQTGETWDEFPERYLSTRQSRKMPTRPDMVVQFAGYLAARYEEERGRPVEVRATVVNSLNGREEQPLVDARVEPRG